MKKSPFEPVLNAINVFREINTMLLKSFVTYQTFIIKALSIFSGTGYSLMMRANIVLAINALLNGLTD